MSKFLHFVFLTLLILLQSLVSEGYNVGSRQYRIQYLTTEQGLSQNTVDDILLDSNGFMWFATWNGLCRFDGYNFVKLTPPSSGKVLPTHFVQCLAEDENSRLWIGTSCGLAVYDLNTETFVTIGDVEDRFAQLSVKDIFCEDSTVWIATEQAGLFEYTTDCNGNMSLVVNWQSVKGQACGVNLVYPLNKDTLLLGTTNGAYLFSKQEHKSIENQFLQNATVGSDILSAYYSQNGDLWIGMRFFLLRFGNDFQIVKQYSNDPNNDRSLVHNSVRAITADSNGDILIGTLGGVCIYSPVGDDFSRIEAEPYNNNKLNNAFVNSLFCDDRGNVWIGTEKGGINRYNIYQKPFESYAYNVSDDNSISSPTINSVFSENNNLWIGTAGGGLNLIDKRSGNVCRFRNNPFDDSSISSDFIPCIVKHGKMYVGTWGNGFCVKRCDKSNRFERFFHQSNDNNSLVDNFVSSMFVDPRGFIMVCTEGGLDIFDPEDESFTHISEYLDGMKISEVGCIELDQRGDYWVGTRKGLFRFPSHKVSPHNVTLRTSDVDVFRRSTTSSQSLPGNYITAIRRDSKGQLWIGSYGNGITKVKIDREGNALFETFNQEDGLSNNVVYSIEESHNGMIWISTENGLSSFDPVTRLFVNYYERDGLLNNQFYWSASFSERDGYIYFGGVNGLNYFDPDKMNESPFVNNVVFSDLKIYNNHIKPLDNPSGIVVLTKPIYKTSDVTLSYRDNVFSIDFTALDYAYPEKVKYSYKMEGVDNEWITVGSDRRFATYSNLGGGEYQFKVMATNSDGTWSDNISTLKVTVRPPFWQTAQFRASLLILIILLVLFLIRKKTQSLVKQKNRLEELVTERTRKIEEQKEILLEQSENLKSNNMMLEQRQTLIEGQKAELESKNREILSQRDKLIELNEQVQHVNQMRLRFFTNISHEFRTPLTLIIDPLQNLMERWKDDAPTMEILRIIDRNAQRLLHLINQLMYFRRIEMGKVKLRVEEVDAVAFVRDLSSSFRDLALHQKIYYKVEIEEYNKHVWFDKEKMENILYNLLSNAFKFTKPNGYVGLSMSFEEDNDGGDDLCYCDIKVVDSGVGINKKDLDLVFDRFYQVENPSNSQVRGSGIGLSLAKELVIALRGHIHVESEPDKGTTFILRIPCGKNHFVEDERFNEKVSDENLQIEKLVAILDENISQLEAAESDSNLLSEQTDRNKPMVLVVEDNYDMRNFLVLSLSDDFRVIEAGNGKSGLDMAVKYTPDLIVSDIMMPVMDGLELCSRVKSDIQTCHIPIILLTAKALTENWIEGLETGADDYVPKPFNLSVLKAKIRNLIDNRKKLVKLFSRDLCPDVERVTSNTLDEEFLQKTYDVMERNYTSPEFSAEDFAREMCISKSLLYKKLKSLTGMSISDWENSYKIKKSLKLLAEGRMGVSDIAFSVGFNDPKYFSRVFRKFMGMTPSAYSEEA